MQKEFKNLFLPIQLRKDIAEKVYSIKGKRDFKKLSCKYYYVAHILYITYVFFQEKYQKKGSTVCTLMLKNTFGNKRDGSEILSNLQEWGIIDMQQNYSEGKARTYKLSPKYENMKIALFRIFKREAAFIDKLIRRATNREALDIEKNQLNILKNRVSISNQGIEWIGNKYPDLKELLSNYESLGSINIPEDLEFEAEDLILLSFLNKDFFCVRPDIENRVYTNFTSLKRDYRPFIQLDGKS